MVDVSDPSAMKLTGSFDVEGSYLSARLVDGVARIVVRSYPKLGFVYPADGITGSASVGHRKES